MQLHPLLLAACFVATLTACNVAPNESPTAPPVQSPTADSAADPMASFARLVGGEWKMTAPGMTGQMFDTAHWGPGRHSVRVMTDGTGARDEPWRELQVFYWHPGLDQVRLLGLSPFARGVSEGWIRFDGETADGVFDTDQIYGHRDLGLRWVFHGPDEYQDVLLEAKGPAGLEWMNEWKHVRSHGPPAPRTVPAEKAAEPSKLPAILPSLVGHAWRAKGNGPDGDALDLRSTFESVPDADGIYVRVVAPTTDGEPEHLFDAYVYHHTGRAKLRGLALSNRGGVYEGDVIELEGGAIQLDLKGYEGERIVDRVARLDVEKDGSPRLRVWSVEDGERALVLDVHHEKLAQAND